METVNFFVKTKIVEVVNELCSSMKISDKNSKTIEQFTGNLKQCSLVSFNILATIILRFLKHVTAVYKKTNHIKAQPKQ